MRLVCDTVVLRGSSLILNDLEKDFFKKIPNYFISKEEQEDWTRGFSSIKKSALVDLTIILTTATAIMRDIPAAE